MAAPRYRARGELLERALANDPDVLLANERTGNLDSQTCEEQELGRL
jgi:predicted ABC-type transport system involved in lysophospholipase L1 biosynthesis ATPase subunit